MRTAILSALVFALCNASQAFAEPRFEGAIDSQTDREIRHVMREEAEERSWTYGSEDEDHYVRDVYEMVQTGASIEVAVDTVLKTAPRITIIFPNTTAFAYINGSTVAQSYNSEYSIREGDNEVGGDMPGRPACRHILHDVQLGSRHMKRCDF